MTQKQPPPFAATATALSASKERLPAKLYCILGTALFALIFALSFFTSSPPRLPSPDPYLFPNKHNRLIVRRNPDGDDPSPPPPPSIAYLISGSKGDSSRILRLLHAVYHPRNHYLLHLDLRASQLERESLALGIRSISIFNAAENVNVIGKADFVYQKGSSPLSSLLHGASILLRISEGWDWFVNLSASDYPLVTQDDLLHIFSYLPKEFNFVNHSNYLGWRELKKLKPIIVDPGLYLSEKSEMFYATQKRDLPQAYRLFAGSSSSILSRDFVEYSILGTENLPRTLLMYLSNTPSSDSFYFPTILCNSRTFNRTVVNPGLTYASFHPELGTLPLTGSNLGDLVESGAAFGSHFKPDDPVLDSIDKQLLNRGPGMQPVPGGWCLGNDSTCHVWGDANMLRPGPGASRLERRIVGLLSNGNYRSHQCAVTA